MTCPACGMPSLTPADACPQCGFDLAGLRMTLTRVYLVTGAVFLSVLVYAVVVAVVPREGEPALDPRLALYGVIVLSAVALLALLHWRSLPQTLSAEEMMRRVVVQATLAETPAVLGLAAALVTHQIAPFAVALVFTLLGFMALASRIPRYAAALAEHLAREHRAAGARR